MLPNITDFTSAFQGPRKPQYRILPHFILRLPGQFYGRSFLLQHNWDMGPFAAVLQCLYLTRLSSSDTIWRHYGTKNNCMHMQLGQILNQRYKETKNPTTISEEPGAKTVSEAKIGYCACPLHSTSPKEWVKHLSHPSGLTPGHTPTLILYKEQIGTLLYGASKQGKLVSSWSHLLQQGPQ